MTSSNSAPGSGTTTGPTDDVPTRLTPTQGSSIAPVPVALCGPVPTSSGPLAKLAQLSLSNPATAPAGSALPASVTVTMDASAPRVITISASSALLVVRDGQIVGGAHGRSATTIPLQPNAGAAQPATAVPTSIRLDGCAGTAKLAKGRYSLVAVLGYRVDSLNSAFADAPAQAGGQTFVLVSTPAPLTVS